MPITFDNLDFEIWNTVAILICFFPPWISPTRIGHQHRITKAVLVLMQAIRPRRIARVWIDRREFALSGTIPPRTQVDEPGRRILQLAGEAKGRHGAALGRAPGVVVDDAERRRGSVEGAAHAAQRVGGVPGRGAA